MWPLTGKENLDKIIKKASMNPVVKIERCSTTMQNGVDEKPPNVNTMKTDADKKPPKIDTMQNDVGEKPLKVNTIQNDVEEVKVSINRFPTNVMANIENNATSKIKVEHKQDLTKNKVSSQKKETNNNILAIVKPTPSMTYYKECPALKNCPNLQRLLSVSSVQTGGLGSSMSPARSSVSPAGSSVSTGGSSISPARSSLSTGGPRSSATSSHFKVDTTSSIGKEVKKEPGEFRDEELCSKRQKKIKKSNEGDDVIILPAMKTEDETVLEASQSEMNKGPTIHKGDYKGAFNQNIHESSWKSDDHSKGMRKMDKIKLKSDTVRGRGVSRIMGGLERNPSTIQIQGQQRINKGMYKKHVSSTKVLRDEGRKIADQSTGRGVAHHYTGRGVVHGSNGRGVVHQYTGRGVVHGSNGRGMVHGSNGRGVVHQSNGRGIVDQFSGRGMVDQFTGRGMVDQSTGRWVTEGLTIERRTIHPGFSTARGMGYPSTEMGIVGELPIETEMADAGCFTGQEEIVDPPIRKPGFISNKSNVRRRRLPTGCGLGIIEPGMEASKRFMLAPGNSRGVPRKRSVGKMITHMSGRGLPRMRKSLPVFKGQRNIGATNGEKRKPSNAGHQRISSLDEGARRRIKTFNPKQEVIEVVNLSDEDSSPNDGPRISSNNCSTHVPNISPDVCVSSPTLANKLAHCNVSVSWSQQKPQQLEMTQQLEIDQQPEMPQLPPGISITRLSSNEASSSDQKNLSTPERIVQVLSGTDNRDTGPKKNVQLNLSDSQINVMKTFGLL